MNEESNNHSSMWSWVFGIICILLITYIFDWGFLKGEITEYGTAPCPECPTGRMTLNSRVYKPNVSRQEVISWMPDFDGVDKYTKCAVVTRKNWECTYNDGSGKFGFSDGHYWNDDDRNIKEDWRFVSRIQYLLIYWKNAF